MASGEQGATVTERKDDEGRASEATRPPQPTTGREKGRVVLLRLSRCKNPSRVCTDFETRRSRAIGRKSRGQ